MKECLRGTLKSKGEELYRAIRGFFEDHHRWLLEKMLANVEHLEHLINDIQVRLRSLLEPYEDVIDRLTKFLGLISYQRTPSFLKQVRHSQVFPIPHLCVHGLEFVQETMRAQEKDTLDEVRFVKALSKQS